MYPTKQQLDGKWWHRLIMVLMYGSTALMFFSFLSEEYLDEMKKAFEDGQQLFDSIYIVLVASFWLLAVPSITFLIQYIFYRKVFLYIVFGSKQHTLHN